MLGMHGTYESNMAMHHCDLILAIGARFDDRVTNTISKFCPYAKVIHVDIDPTSISKNIEVDVPIVGPVVNVLEEMIALAETRISNRTKIKAENLAEWWEQIEGWRRQDCLKVLRDDQDPEIKPQEVVQASGVTTWTPTPLGGARLAGTRSLSTVTTSPRSSMR